MKSYIKTTFLLLLTLVVSAIWIAGCKKNSSLNNSIVGAWTLNHTNETCKTGNTIVFNRNIPANNGQTVVNFFVDSQYIWTGTNSTTQGPYIINGDSLILVQRLITSGAIVTIYAYSISNNALTLSSDIYLHTNPDTILEITNYFTR